ncbi:TonB-dependent receptor [Nitrospirillum sp. BR 11163]|uniref:TonB-dependent receptor n=1 Tax=Nitrospirillum sp. BR 11163 TaxID=3104323 RepID=UPI002AFFE17E|nr:TonB-dependent receptor [Nitrospirillum sp. BR 11163]MEA1672824.1 TonB-dependent receptor [Nitrospirillum sp. BR 11163]
MEKMSRLLVSVPMLATCFAGAKVYAQDAAMPVIEEIIVTAQKRSERINDVPLSINVATGEDLAKGGVTDTSQLVKIVPGFTYQLSPYGTPVYGLRGISFFDTSGLAQPAVSVYVDQVPLPLSILARGASLDVERVEVLKGPQGTLFGENATGGAINYIAAKPTNSFSAGADVVYGRFNQGEAGGYISGPLSNTLSVRLAGRTEQRGDWQYSTTRQDGAGQRGFNEGRVLLDWKPDADFQFELNVNGWKDQSDTQVAQFRRFAPGVPNGYAPAIAALSAYQAAPDNARAADWDSGFSLRRDDRFFQTSLRGDWDVTEQLALTSLTSYIWFRGETPVDPDGTNYLDLTNTQRDAIDVTSQELRASLTTGPLKWLAGGYYQHQRLREDADARLAGTNSLIAGVANSGGVYLNHQKVDTYAGFAGVDADLGGGVTLQGSVRYTKQDRDFSGCARDNGDGTFAMSFSRLSTLLSGSPTVLPPGACVTLSSTTGKPAGLISQSLDQDNVLWRTSLNWKPDEHTLLYVNATKGFKAGGFSTLPYAIDKQINPVTQESVQAYEVGAKLTLAAGRLQLNGAAFHYDYTNKQIQGYLLIQPFGNLPALINIPKSEVDGGELSLTWQALSALRISASATYVDARVAQDFATLDPFAVPINVKGQQLPGTPRWQGNIDAEYRFNLSGRWQPYAGAALAYQSRSYSAFGQNAEFVLPGHTLLDLRAGIERDDGRWRIEAFGHNVTDRYYWLSVSHQIDAVTRLAAQPATYGARATFRY